MPFTPRRMTVDEFFALPPDVPRSELGPGDTLTTPLLPGFALDLTSLFDR